MVKQDISGLFSLEFATVTIDLVMRKKILLIRPRIPTGLMFQNIKIQANSLQTKHDLVLSAYRDTVYWPYTWRFHSLLHF
ncbi:hypothetical protein JYU34_021535 [Plutella xylostella]|uniref:Uncharacterized protein n=1 Tax=Plutella xylostella TaxID=51655 RepID=A0ABQ7PTV2_PLUXY|nr:hypothetical protein JYU34_021535 [Plutella xylostella]